MELRGAGVEALCQPPNKQLQRSVMDKVPSHERQRAAAEPRRYASQVARFAPELSLWSVVLVV